MEDILEVYKRPYYADTPLVCMDETTKQLVKEIQQIVGAKPGRAARVDHQYERNGVCNLFMFYEPFGSYRYVCVTERRTKIDWALQIRELLDNHYPHAKKVILVMDNLNTHQAPLCMTPFLLRKPDGCWIVWKFTTHQSTAVGSI